MKGFIKSKTKKGQGINYRTPSEFRQKFNRQKPKTTGQPRSLGGHQ